MSDYKISEEISLGGPYLHQLSQLMAQFDLADQGAKRLKTNLSEIGFSQAWLRQVSTVVEKIELINRAIAGAEGKIGTMQIKPSAVESLAGYGKHFDSLSSVVAKTADAIDRRWADLLSSSAPHERISALRDHFGTLALSASEAAKTIRTEVVGAFSAARTEAGTIGKEIAGWGTDLAAFERRYGEVRAQMSRPIQSGGMFGGGAGGGGGILDTLAMGPQHSGVFAGQNVEHQVADLLKANGELQRQVNLYRLSRASEADVTLAKSAAYQSAIQVPDVGVAEQMKLYRELVSATGDKEGAAKMLPQVAKNKSVMEALSGHSSEQDMAQLFKFIELRGVAINEHTHKIDPEKFGAELEYAAKARVAAMGMVKNGDFLNFVKQAGPMAKGMGGQELFNDFLATMEDMGGSRTGTSLSAIGRQFIGGIMTGDKAKRLNELGLLNKDQYGDGVGWHYNKEGGIKIDDMSKALVGYDVLKKQGFGKFATDVYRPHLNEHGITSKEDQNEELFRSLSTEQARRQMGMFISNFEQMAMVAERFQAAMGSTEGYDKIFGSGEDYQTSVKALSESLHTLRTALGNGDQIAPVLMMTARGIAHLANAMKSMPAVGSVATLGGVGASAGLLGYGAYQTVKGFGLPQAAAELILAAKALDAAAARQALPHVTPSGVPSIAPGGAAGAAAGAAGAATAASAAGTATSLMTRAGQAFGVALVAALAKDVTHIGAEWVDDKTGTKAGTKAWDFAFKPFGVFGHAYDWWSGGDKKDAPPEGVPHRARGGFVFGPGGPTTDSVPAMLSNGEYVVSAAAAARNKDLLEAINSGADLSGGGTSGGRGSQAVERLPDTTDKATQALLRLWSALHRLGEAGGMGGGAQWASLGGGGGFTSGFGGGGGARGGGGGGVSGLAGIGGSNVERRSGGGRSAGGGAVAGLAGVGEGGPTQDIPGTLNPRLAGARKSLMDELDRDPALRRDVIKTASMESRGSPFKMQAVLESMVNRSKMNGYTSLRQAVHSGFYGPVNRGGLRGALSEKDRQDGEAALKQVRMGSNAIGYRTDQGMLTDPGARRYMKEADHSGHKVIGGENYFYMGQKGREWARRQEAADAANIGAVAGFRHTAGVAGPVADMAGPGQKRPRDAHGHAENDGGFRSSGWRRVQWPEGASKARPEASLPRASQTAQITTNLHVDGRKMATVVTPHQFNRMNGPGRGANFADRGRLYPQAA